MNDHQITLLAAVRARLTNQRDEQIDWRAVDLIDILLDSVPPGQRNDVDLLLGRPGAILPVRAALQAAAAEVGVTAEHLTPQQVARLDNQNMTRIARDAMQKPPIEY